MGAILPFDIPCFAIAHKKCDDTIEMSRSLVASDFGNIGRCVLLFQSRKTVEDAARALGHDIIVEVENVPFLLLILDAEKGYGGTHVAVDLVRTKDGQTACHFHAIDSMLAAFRTAGAMDDEPA